MPAERRRVQVAQRAQPRNTLRQEGHRPGAIGAARLQDRGARAPSGAGVADHHANPGRQGHVASLEGAAIQEQRRVLAAGGAGKLVHDPAVDADVVALGALGQGRQSRSGHQAPVADQGHGGGQLQRRRRAEAGPIWDRGIDHAVEATDREGGFPQRPGNGGDVVAPASLAGRGTRGSGRAGGRCRARDQGPVRRRKGADAAGRADRRRRRQVVDPERARIARVPRSDPDQPVPTAPKRDPHVQLDRGEQDEGLVSIRVVAYQADAPWGASDLDALRVGRRPVFGLQGGRQHVNSRAVGPGEHHGTDASAPGPARSPQRGLWPSPVRRRRSPLEATAAMAATRRAAAPSAPRCGPPQARPQRSPLEATAAIG